MSYCKDCYRHSNEKSHAMWFAKPCCSMVHQLVFAKQTGYNYWPAKVVRIIGNQYDVRFFGTNHMRASVNAKSIKPIEEMNGPSKKSLKLKSSSSLTKAFAELKKHQELLKLPIDYFSYEYEQKNGNTSLLLNSTIDSINNSESPKITTVEAIPIAASTPSIENIPKNMRISLPKALAKKFLKIKNRRQSVRISSRLGNENSDEMLPVKKNELNKVANPQNETLPLKVILQKSLKSNSSSSNVIPVTDTPLNVPSAVKRSLQSSSAAVVPVPTNMNDEDHIEYASDEDEHPILKRQRLSEKLPVSEEHLTKYSIRFSFTYVNV